MNGIALRREALSILMETNDAKSSIDLAGCRRRGLGAREHIRHGV
jgi:hypothetical protein